MQKNYPVVKCSDFKMATEYQRKSPLFGHLLTNWFKKTQIKWAGFWMASEYQTCIQIDQLFQYWTFTSPVFGCFWYSGFLVIGFPFYSFQIWFTKGWRKEHEFPFFNNKAFSHVQSWDSPMFKLYYIIFGLALFQSNICFMWSYLWDSFSNHHLWSSFLHSTVELRVITWYQCHR